MRRRDRVRLPVHARTILLQFPTTLCSVERVRKRLAATGVAQLPHEVGYHRSLFIVFPGFAPRRSRFATATPPKQIPLSMCISALSSAYTDFPECRR